MNILSLLTNSSNNKPEDEHDLWRWMIDTFQQYMNPQNPISEAISKFMEGDGGKLVNRIKDMVIPKINGASPAITTVPPATPETSPVQAGGAFKQLDYKKKVFYDFRVDSYEQLMSFLINNNISIKNISKNMLKKLYIYHYDLEYIKMLNYVLFLIKDFKISHELKHQFSNIFNTLSSQIEQNITSSAI